MLGGERDTLTCIAGGIVEGFYGLTLNMKSKCRKRLPEDMLKVLERSKKLDFLKVGEYNFGSSSRRVNINEGKNNIRKDKNVLSKPDAGWSDFQLEGTSVYTLSYLDDIAFDWIEQAIHGLKTLLPFCVKGFLEPNRFLCIVSYWNCHIVCEYDEREPFDEKYVINEMSHTSMIQFCQYLYDDVKKYMDEWSEFVSYGDFDIKKKKQKLEQLLDELKTLIAEKNKYFDEDRGFL